MSHLLVKQIAEAVRLTVTVPPGKLLVGVSGGADSVALLCALLRIPKPPSLCVVHVDHMLREESADDATWVRSLCERLSVACSVVQVDVRARAEMHGVGLEEAARDARYEIFVKEARDVGATHVAVAHHADDNVETILHNILRGTGLSGLSGMPRSRQLADGVTLIRPMLDISRNEVLSFLEQQNSEYRVDQTNSDTSYTRNRIRLDLLPLLERDFNPAVREALQRLGRQATDASAAINGQVRQLYQRTCSSVDATVKVRCDLLKQTPRTVIRSLMRQLWIEQMWPRQKMGFDEWDSLADLILGAGRGRDLPGGVNASVRKATLTLTRNVS